MLVAIAPRVARSTPVFAATALALAALRLSLISDLAIAVLAGEVCAVEPVGFESIGNSLRRQGTRRSRCGNYGWPEQGDGGFDPPEANVVGDSLPRQQDQRKRHANPDNYSLGQTYSRGTAPIPGPPGEWASSEYVPEAAIRLRGVGCGPP